MAPIVAFFFPSKSSDLQPALPISRSLVGMGFEVHFLATELGRGAIESTGATFHCATKALPEVFDGRELDAEGGVFTALCKEHGVDQESLGSQILKVFPIGGAKEMVGLERWAKGIGAQGIVYHGLLKPAAALAAKKIGIPSVAVLPVGPGNFELIVHLICSGTPSAPAGSFEKMAVDVDAFEPSTEAMATLNAVSGGAAKASDILVPPGNMPFVHLSHTVITTTCEELERPMSPELAACFDNRKVSFEAVGPLFDSEGVRSRGARPEILRKVREARAAGRAVVLVNIGPELASDSPLYGWDARQRGPDGKERGLAGRQICKAVWAGAFSGAGGAAASDGPLLVVSTGERPDALEGLTVPPNAICAPSVEQADILKLGVDAFVSHCDFGGFDEALGNAAPIVACPGSSHQVEHAAKAVELGVGVMCERPANDLAGEAKAIAQLQADVARSLQQVRSDGSFRAASWRVAKKVQAAGGAARAAKLVAKALGA